MWCPGSGHGLLPQPSCWEDYRARARRPIPKTSLAEIVATYGLRNWVEQGYKQVKQELGWADFMVRSDRAIRRHWHLVFCAFSFCWRAWFAASAAPTAPVEPTAAVLGAPTAPTAAPAAGRGENGARQPDTPRLLANDPPPCPRLAGPVDIPRALLARLVERAPAPGTPSPARLSRPGTTAQPLPPALTNYR